MKRTKSGSGWIQDRKNDEFMLRARKEGYRSRSSYKLIEINEKYRLLKPGMTVVDLGAAPGGWTQVVLSQVGPFGRVISIDILDMEYLPGATLLKGDFTTDEAFEELLGCLDGIGVDLVISDMAPNLSGMKEIDQPRAMHLVELVYEFGKTTLKPGGHLLLKCFEGEGINQLRQEFRNNFRHISNLKPKASRPKSREVYLLGQKFLH